MHKTSLQKKLNFAAALSFGLTTLLASLCGVVGLFIWLYRVFTHQTVFSWSGLAGFALISFVLFVIGIVILKNGVDEMKRK